MSRFRAFIEEVRKRTDLAEIIAADTELRECGSTLKALSPFHAETDPSFVVWPKTQTWHDFSQGGGRGGDVFAYVQERDGCSFKEAVCTLAARVGVRAPPSGSSDILQEIAQWEERREVERILSLAASYYHHTLPSKVRETWYRAQYGLSDETIKGLLLGWADGNLYHHLSTAEGLSREQALRTGLFVERGDGRIEDFFQDRLVFPYWKAGRVVYFIARATEFTGDEAWEKPKYKKLRVHSEKHRYISSVIRNDSFYNEDAALDATELLVTEGVTDCIAALQAGIPCISPVTTRFRHSDLPKLLALTRPGMRVVICNDSEASGAGEAGALETATFLTQEGRSVHLVTLPRPAGVDKVDLNDYLRTHGADALRALMADAPVFPQFLLDRLPPETPAHAELEHKLAPVLKATAASGPLVQEQILSAITQRFGIKRQPLKALLKQHAPAEPRSAPKSRDEHAEASAAAASDGAASLERMRGEICEELDFYYVQYEDLVERISSFSIEPTERIECEEGQYIKADLLTRRGQRFQGVVFPPNAWHSRREFLQALPAPDCQWTGNDNNLQGVLQIITRREVPVRRGVSTLGYVETNSGPRWVAPDVVIAPDGFRDQDAVLYLPGKKTSLLAERVRYPLTAQEETHALAREVLPRLLALNETRVVLPILGWFFATPFRPRIMATHGKFPILCVWGTQGSGKTSLIKHIFWPLAGVKPNTDAFSATATQFTLLRHLSTTNAVPLFIDEYKPKDMGEERVKLLNRYVRCLYNGEVISRGRADQSMVHYLLTAPVCLAGESPPEGDDALNERLISVSPNKNTLRLPRVRATFQKLRGLALNHLAAPYIQFALGRDTAQDLAQAERVTESVLAQAGDLEQVQDRCRHNLMIMIFGLIMFEEFAQSLGVETPELDIDAAVGSCIASTKDADSRTKDAFDRFLESLAAYALMGSLVEGRHYAMVNGFLCIHLRSCYEVYRTERRRAGLDDETNGLNALRRILREKREQNGYVVQLDRRVHFGKPCVRTIMIDPDKVPGTLDIDAFTDSAEHRTADAS